MHAVSPPSTVILTLTFIIPRCHIKQLFLLKALQRILPSLFHPRQGTVDPVVNFRSDNGEMRFHVDRAGRGGELGGMKENWKKKDGKEGIGDVVDLRAASDKGEKLERRVSGNSVEDDRRPYTTHVVS